MLLLFIVIIIGFQIQPYPYDCYNSSSPLPLQVCKRPLLRDRIKTLSVFITLCTELFEMNNLNGVMEILSGINSAAIRRLKFTFAGLPKQKMDQLKKIEEGE